MLAQNFMTAGALGLTDEERAAHVVVLGMLERGELAHGTADVCPRGDLFNMSTTGRFLECGSVACIAGWVRHMMGAEPFNYASLLERCEGNDELYNLYFACSRDPLEHFPLDKITVDQAARALRSYLTTGTPHWEEALA